MEAQFEEAGKLIRAKRYAEARQILETIDHPKAQRWLARLDEIAPDGELEIDHEAGIDMLLNSASTGIESDMPKQKAKLPYGEPRNPDGGGVFMTVLSFFMPFIVFPLWNIYFAFNWRRLGKPGWMKIALAASLLTGGGFWLSIPIMAVVGVLSQGISFSVVWIVILTLGVSTFWLWMVQRHLQAAAYKVWKDTGSAEMLYQHSYPVRRSVLMHGAGAVALAVFLFMSSASAFQPQVFSDTALTLEYPAAWETRDIETTSACNNLEEDERCVVVLADDDYGYGGLTLYEYPLPGTTTLEALADSIWENIAEWDKGVLVSRTETTIDEQPAVVLEYSFTEGEKDWYGMLILTFNGDHYYQVFAYSRTQEKFEKARRSIQQIYGSIQFTGS